MTVRDKEENALSRWSNRKRQVARESNVADEVVESEDSEDAEIREAKLLANREAAEAIDLDTINEESDLSLFMKEGVPDALRRKALSVLWRSNPVFANLDGLNDYDENFADPKLIMKTFTSAYRIGKGYLKDIVEEEDDTVTTLTEIEETPNREDSGDNEHENTSGPTVEETAQPEMVDEPDAGNLRDEIEELPKVSLRKRLNLDS
ncbi:MAG: DUF3306 domain-containing protein [Rhizobiaceae bacterium]